MTEKKHTHEQDVLIAFGPHVRSGNLAAQSVHSAYLANPEQSSFIAGARNFLIRRHLDGRYGDADGGGSAAPPAAAVENGEPTTAPELRSMKSVEELERDMLPSSGHAGGVENPARTAGNTIETQPGMRPAPPGMRSAPPGLGNPPQDDRRTQRPSNIEQRRQGPPINLSGTRPGPPINLNGAPAGNLTGPPINLNGTPPPGMAAARRRRAWPRPRRACSAPRLPDCARLPPACARRAPPARSLPPPVRPPACRLR